MAVAESIRGALTELYESVLFFDSLVKTCVHLQTDGDDGNPWVFVVGRAFDAVKASAEELEMLVRAGALPLLEDMDKLSRVK